MKFLIVLTFLIPFHSELAKSKPTPKSAKIEKEDTTPNEWKVVKLKSSAENGDKGDLYLDPLSCHYVIKRQDLSITLITDKTTNAESFQITFPNQRTIIGAVENNPACFHSLTGEKKKGYMIKAINSSKLESQNEMQNCIDSAIYKDKRKANYVVTEIWYVPTKDYCRGPSFQSDCWELSQKFIIKNGTGLTFLKGYGPNIGSNITRNDLKVRSEDQSKCVVSANDTKREDKKFQDQQKSALQQK